MATGAIQTTANASQVGAAAPQTQMGKEDFLKLLVAQLSHQDPLKPQEGAEFVAQLAQFSNLEQMISANAQLASISSTSASQRDAQAYNLIGKHVTASTRTVEMDGFSGATLQFSVGSAAESARITITDDHGNVVRIMETGALPAGAVTVPWDGMNQDGDHAQAGTYRVAVSAKAKNGAPVPVTSEAGGVVKGVVFVNGKTMLDLGTTELPLETITSVQ